jgi:hypothetical protein
MAHITHRLLPLTLAGLCACAAGMDVTEAETAATFGAAESHETENATTGEDSQATTAADADGATEAGDPAEDTTSTSGIADEDDSTGDDADPEDPSGDGSTSSTDPSTTDGDNQPATVDLSDWTVVQTASDRTFTLPVGTLLPAGGWIVVGRAADQAAFESFWGVTFGDDVIYIDSQDEFPSINGDETFSLLDPGAVMVDGPTPALVAGQNLQRTDAMMAAWYEEAWDVSANPNAYATPGTSPALQAQEEAYISEVSDVLGAGLWVYEFVEIHVPGPAPD